MVIGKNKVIYAQGDVADHIFYIQKGQIQLTVLSGEGKEAIIAVLEAGDFAGEGCMVGEPMRMLSATTLTENASSLGWKRRPFSAPFMRTRVSRNTSFHMF